MLDILSKAVYKDSLQDPGVFCVWGISLNKNCVDLPLEV